jgi:uncharacterized integral membrane protein
MAVFIILVIGFAMQNTDQQASIRFLSYETINLPLWLVMYASFGIGLLFWLIVSIFQVLGLKNNLRKKDKEIKRLKNELDQLRNVSVEDTVIPSSDQSTKSQDMEKRNKE